MPKVDSNYLKSAVLECKKEIKQKGRDGKGRFYGSSGACRVLQALLAQALSEGQQSITTLSRYSDSSHLDRMFEGLKRIMTYDLNKRFNNRTPEENAEKAHALCSDIVKNFARTCPYYREQLSAEIEAIVTNEMDTFIKECIRDKKPLTHSKIAEVRSMQIKIVPVCRQLIRAWESFNASVKQAHQDMQDNKPIDRLEIARFAVLVEQEAKKIQATSRSLHDDGISSLSSDLTMLRID